MDKPNRTHDPRAIRAALSDPQAVARALGLEKGARRGGGGLLVRCPAHGDRTPSMSLRVAGDGTLSARCFACSWAGDVLALVACVDGLDVRRDFGRVLERAAELAGGFVRATVKESLQVRPEAPRLPAAAAAGLFERICERGRLWARGAVEAYLERRGLLEAARDDGWATLPSLQDLLDIAREMCQESGAQREFAGTHGEASGQVSGVFAFGGPGELLIAAKLARRDREGRLRVMYGRHRLVIPWRGPDGRIQALQRRLIDAPRVWRGQEEPRYVLTWAPRWPYGVERLGGEYGADIEHEADCGNSRVAVRGLRAIPRHAIEQQGRGRDRASSTPNGQGSWDQVAGAGAAGEAHVQWSAPSAIRTDANQPVIFIEGAVDALAMRLLRPGRCVPLGLPGTGAWESSWARLVGERASFYGTDSDASGDKRAAQAAIDVAEAQGLKPEAARRARAMLDERMRALAQIKRDEEQGRLTCDVAAERREALGPARCVLCGAEAELLCRGCGRVRARGKDWGEMWKQVRQKGRP